MIGRCYTWAVRFSIIAVAALGGCTWVYDGQYNDRAGELEEFRSEFLPAESKVQFIQADGERVFWVDIIKPADEAVLHSHAPGTGERLDYEWSKAELAVVANFEARFRIGGSRIIKCNFNRVTAFDAGVANAELGETEMGSEDCAVTGNNVYIVVSRNLQQWTPGPSAPVTLANIDGIGVGNQDISGFGVAGTTAVLAEGGDLWTIDLAQTPPVARWTENPSPVGGLVVFDEAGAVYETNEGVLYTSFADLTTFNLEDAVKDGGYHMSFKHADIHEITSSAREFFIHGRHVIYRANRGIFAYGLDSKKVVDLLLDRGEGFEAEAIYRSPVVTTDGTLFVLDDNNLSSDDRPVYQVDLSDRLR